METVACFGIADDLLVREDYFMGRWVCVRCGKCCNWRGFRVTGEELKKLAVLKEMSEAEFKERYMDKEATKNLVELREFYRDPAKTDEYVLTQHPCPFYGVCSDGSDGCVIYDDRPQVCRTFPFVEGKLSENCPQVVYLIADIVRRADELEAKKIVFRISKMKKADGE